MVVKKKIISFIVKVYRRIEYLVEEYDWIKIKDNFKSVGENCHIPSPRRIFNPHFISIGDNFSSLYNTRLEAFDEYNGTKYNPEIIIGSNVILNSDCHIGCIDKVSIGNNVLMASRVYISDHSHGAIDATVIDLAPVFRPLYSKGPVIIEDNVWIGEGVCVLPGVTIGANSIIGANSVVTKNIPANSVAAGVPARIIKMLD